MGTHVYVFCTTETAPTTRELLSWAAVKGHQLKINPELFDDEDEEHEFLAENLDSAQWTQLSFASGDDKWVLDITAQRKNDPNAYFQETMDAFKSMVADAKRSRGLETVI